MRAFLDTNVLVYMFDEGEPTKQRAARALVHRLFAENVEVCISTQVAIEFFNTMRRFRATAEQSLAHDEALELYECRPTTMDTIRSARQLSRAHTISWFDALIVQAALDARCTQLYSEDLQHGRRFGALEIVNPFQ